MTLCKLVLGEDLMFLLRGLALICCLAIVSFEHSYSNTFCKALFLCHAQLLLLQCINLVELGNEFALSLQLLHLLVDDLIQQILEL